jgi:Ca2+-binding RTX toxin-like protein
MSALVPAVIASAAGGGQASKAVVDVSAARAAASGGYTLIVRSEPGFVNTIRISRDGGQWVIKSNGNSPAQPPCTNPGGNERELRCPVSQFVAFDVSTLDGNDTVILAADVTAPAVLNGGAGVDDLVGGANSDKLLGGGGDDRLVGRAGADKLYGNAGNDILVGNGGKDTLRGGAGNDVLRPGPGRDDIRQ